jgi:hypothetical protein
LLGLSALAALSAVPLLGAAPALAAPGSLPAAAAGALKPVAAPRIDVAFVLDATGSMGPWIEQARCRIKAVAADLASGDPAPEVRFGLVRFRDTTDKFVTEVVPFTAHIDVMAAALEATEAAGGGDFPEAVLEGLDVALTQLKWSAGDDVVRLIYLVGDAPPQVGPGRPDENAVVERALDAGIVVHSLACGSAKGGAQPYFDRFARHTEGRVFQVVGGGKTCDAAPKAVAGKVPARKPGTTDLGSAVSGSARDYSTAAGVDFTAAHAVAAEPVAALKGAQATGLLGAQVRQVTDAATFADLWAAHGSAVADPVRASVPAFDFEVDQVLVLGGADAGLEVVAVNETHAARQVTVRSASPGARFVRLAASDLPLVVLRADAPALDASDDADLGAWAHDTSAFGRTAVAPVGNTFANAFGIFGAQR